MMLVKDAVSHRMCPPCFGLTGGRPELRVVACIVELVWILGWTY